MRDVTLYLKDILESMRAIEAFVEGMDFKAFMQDLKTRSAVVRQLEVIGEAAKKVPDPIRRKNPGVAWRQMAGMRDRLVHAYFDVDYAIVWDLIKDLIPTEKPVIQRIIDDSEASAG
jgi:uncharacterized protein with HEPN domain